MKISQLTKKVLLPFLIGTILHASSDISSNEQSLRTLPSEYNMIVAYYGRPNVKSLGLLGKSSLEDVMQQVKAKAKEYEKALDNGQKVTPGFDLIYELATRDSGRAGNYVLTLNEKTLLKYITTAQKNGIVVLLV